MVNKEKDHLEPLLISGPEILLKMLKWAESLTVEGKTQALEKRLKAGSVRILMRLWPTWLKWTKVKETRS